MSEKFERREWIIEIRQIEICSVLFLPIYRDIPKEWLYNLYKRRERVHRAWIIKEQLGKKVY